MEMAGAAADAGPAEAGATNEKGDPRRGRLFCGGDFSPTVLIIASWWKCQGRINGEFVEKQGEIFLKML
jgi:hypothetical protein